MTEPQTAREVEVDLAGEHGAGERVSSDLRNSFIGWVKAMPPEARWAVAAGFAVIAGLAALCVSKGWVPKSAESWSAAAAISSAVIAIFAALVAFFAYRVAGQQLDAAKEATATAKEATAASKEATAAAKDQARPPPRRSRPPRSRSRSVRSRPSSPSCRSPKANNRSAAGILLRWFPPDDVDFPDLGYDVYRALVPDVPPLPFNGLNVPFVEGRPSWTYGSVTLS